MTPGALNLLALLGIFWVIWLLFWLLRGPPEKASGPASAPAAQEGPTAEAAGGSQAEPEPAFEPIWLPTALLIRVARGALLSRFRYGCNPYQFSHYPQLDERLGEPATLVIEQFIREGLLRKLTAAEALSQAMRVQEMKAILERHGLPKAGRKADLAERLAALTQQDEQVQQAAQSLYYIASDAGLQVLRAFDQEQLERYEATHEAVAQALDEGNLRQALYLSCSYTQLQIGGGYSLTYDAWGLSALQKIIDTPLGSAREKRLAALQALLPRRPPSPSG